MLVSNIPHSDIKTEPRIILLHIFQELVVYLSR